jgi:peptidoglycan L-alanyl-D-glutamate endopeptidase CwlK
MTLRQHQVAFAWDTMKLYAFIKEKGYEFTYGEAARTMKQQEWYVAQGFSKTMTSMHLRRLAVDLNIFKDGAYLTEKASLQEIGDYWESLSPENEWGGNWKSFIDTPHFQRTVK